MHIHISPNLIIDLIRWIIANPAEAATHVVAYASATVVFLAAAERFVNNTQIWVMKWFPDSKSFIKFLERTQYILSATADLVENLALNWRSAIAPKKLYTGTDRRNDEDQARAANAGGTT